MTIRNPRRYSARFAVSVGLAFLVVVFLSIGFHEGGGSLARGFWSAAHAFLLLGLVNVFVAAVVSGAALLAGRFVGTTVTAAISLGLLLVLLVSSYVKSQPLANFRRLVWADAPGSVQISDYSVYSSFSDGSMYVFRIPYTPELLGELTDAVHLAKSRGLPRSSLAPAIFAETGIPDDAQFYMGDHVELIHLQASQQLVVITRWLWEADAGGRATG